MNQIVRLAPTLVHGVSAGLYINFRNAKEIRLCSSDGPFFENLGTERKYDESVAAQVARTKQRAIVQLTFPGGKEELAVGIPLKHLGEVEYVLIVVYAKGTPEFLDADLEALQFFADRASLILGTAESLKPERRRRVFAPLLYKLGDYIQSTRDLDKITHAVLTSITAGYGLGFNRAALFLFDADRRKLVGQMGIGHLDGKEARLDWEFQSIHRTDDFERYLQRLSRDGLPQITPVGQATHGLTLPLPFDKADLFARAIDTGQPQLISTSPNPYVVSHAFFLAVIPAPDFVLVPLKARDQVLGVIFADKKFLNESISHEEVDLLMSVANTAATAIENLQLLRKTEEVGKRLRSLYEASSDLVSIHAPRELLRGITERLKDVSHAAWVRWTLVDDTNRVYNHDVVGIDQEFRMGTLRPDGIATEVMRSGKAVAIENTQRFPQKNRLNSLVFEKKIGAVLCLPISLFEKRIGLMWLNYQEPRLFSQAEIESLQFYVNQAAVALRRAWRHDNLERMRHAIEALAAVSDSQNEILQKIVETAKHTFDADSAIIWTYDTYRKKFILPNPHAKEISDVSLVKIQELGPQWYQGASRILQLGWIGIEDVNAPEHREFWPEEVHQWIEQVGERSFQGIALAIREEKLGVLFLNYNQPRKFSKEDEEFARAFGNHAVLALKKVMLLEQVHDTNRMLEIIAGGMKYGKHDETLSAIAHGALRVTGSDLVTLYTYDEETDTVHYPPPR